MLGFSGHFATKSRAYSTTLGALRADRAAHQRESAIATGLLPDLPNDTTVTVTDWHYTGRSYLPSLAELAAIDSRAASATAGGAPCPGSC
jgi:Replication initiator protein, pSAM2